MSKQQTRSHVETDLKNNRLNVTFKGIITKSEFERVYTDVRFGVADLQPDFKVLSDFSDCRLMFLNGFPTFRKIFHFILSNNSGEIIRVLHPKRVISKQIINATLHKKGYKPTYVSTREEAEKRINNSTNRDGLRFELHQQYVDIFYKNTKYEGYILFLSTSGCEIESSLQPSKSDEMQIKFAFINQAPSDKFDLTARVVMTESSSFTLQFTPLDNQKKCHLWRCLVDESEGEFR
jgi:PilZ domain